MKKNILLIAVLLVGCFTAYGQTAKEVLDRTAAALKKAGGVETSFTIKMFVHNEPQGGTTGTIRLKDEKFLLESPETITWFDGETQWTYLVGSEEVNITNPTEEELQQINPYALLSIYNRGYTYVIGNTKTFQGKPVTEVVLTATDKKQKLAKINLYVNKAYQPVFIMAQLSDGSRSDITVNSYKAGVKYKESLFVFDEKKYPQAEIIDLRF